MATSADTITNIISVLADKYEFSEEQAISFLGKKELLPKKILRQNEKVQNIWASKRAEEFANEHGIVVTNEKGSGKDGRWTLADVQKHMQKPVKNKILVSPNALILAKEQMINIAEITGSGKGGRILLKDVEAMVQNKESDDELNISARAYQEAQDQSISDDELKKIDGSGQDGRILLKDVQDYHTSSTDENDKKKKDKKQKIKRMPVSSDEEGTDEEE